MTSRSSSGSEDPVMQRDLENASDATLVVSIGRFSQDALAEAYRRHAGAVFGLSKRLLSDHARAEEIVQEVFVRLWNEPNRFDPDRGTLRSFLLANAHGRSVDLIRSDVSRRRREEREASQTARGWPAPCPTLRVPNPTPPETVARVIRWLAEDEEAVKQMQYAVTFAPQLAAKLGL